MASLPGSVPISSYSGSKLVNSLRFKPAHALNAQLKYHDDKRAHEEGRGFGEFDDSELPPETFNDRLKQALKVLEESVSEEAPRWFTNVHDIDTTSDNWNVQDLEDPDIPEEDATRCFNAFVEDVRQIAMSYFSDRAAEKENEFHKRITANTASYLHDVIPYRDRLAPFGRSVDITCPPEDLPLYKPLEDGWSEEEVQVMKEMIDERLRQLLALYNKKEKEEEEEEIKVKEEAKVEEQVEEVEEEDPEAVEADRAAALDAALEEKAKLQSENDELQALLDELRGKLKGVNAEVNELNIAMNSMQKQMGELREPVKELPKPKNGAAPVATKSSNHGVRNTPTNVQGGQGNQDGAAGKGGPDNDSAAQEAADKAAFDAELARLKKEALARNAKEWKSERDGYLRKIGSLEEELERLRRRQAEHNASKVSTVAPPEQAESLDSFEHDEKPVRPRATIAASNITLSRGGVFDHLYNESKARKTRLITATEAQKLANSQAFTSTEQKRYRFGETPGTDKDGYGLFKELYFKDEADSSESGGQSYSTLSELKRGNRNTRSEGQLRVRLKGPLPSLQDWHEPVRPKNENGWMNRSVSGSENRELSSKAGSKRVAEDAKRIAAYAFYDPLRPTIRQVEHNCLIPTAIGRLANEPEPSPEPFQAGPSAESADGCTDMSCSHLDRSGVQWSLDVQDISQNETV
jgi:hypothetical protein